MASAQQALTMASQAATGGLSAVVNAAEYYRDPGSPAGVKFLSDGTVQYKGPASTYTYTYTWRTGTGAGADYEIRATLDAYDNPSVGTMNTWQALSSDRTWERSTTEGELKESQILIEIRDTATHTVLDSGLIFLWAWRESSGGGGGLPP